MKPFLLILFALTGLTLPHSLPAREETGELIELLVDKIDNQLVGLEKAIETRTPESDSRTKRLLALGESYNQATTEENRIRLKTEIVTGLSEINQEDRDLVKLSILTLANVSGDLRQLREVFDSGTVSGGRMANQRQRLRTVLSSVGPMLHGLSSSIQDSSAQQRAAGVEQTLVMLYRQLETISGVNSEGMLAQIQSLEIALEDVVAQLVIVNELLEIEHYHLEVVSKLNVAEMLFARLGNVQIKGRSLVEVPQAFQDGVGERNRQFGSILSSSLAPSVPSTRRAEDRQILDRIRRGELP